MRAEVNTDKKLVEAIREKLRENSFYCPCKIEHTIENLCMCEDFRLRTPQGQYCHCGLYKKVEQ